MMSEKSKNDKEMDFFDKIKNSADNTDELLKKKMFTFENNCGFCCNICGNHPDEKPIFSTVLTFWKYPAHPRVPSEVFSHLHNKDHMKFGNDDCKNSVPPNPILHTKIEEDIQQLIASEGRKLRI